MNDVLEKNEIGGGGAFSIQQIISQIFAVFLVYFGKISEKNHNLNLFSLKMSATNYPGNHLGKIQNDLKKVLIWIEKNHLWNTFWPLKGGV